MSMPIDLASTKELLDELSGRMDHLVVIAVKNTAGQEIEHRQTKGSLRYCQGLAMAMVLHLEDKRKQNAAPKSVEDL